MTTVPFRVLLSAHRSASYPPFPLFVSLSLSYLSLSFSLISTRFLFFFCCHKFLVPSFDVLRHNSLLVQTTSRFLTTFKIDLKRNSRIINAVSPECSAKRRANRKDLKISLIFPLPSVARTQTFTHLIDPHGSVFTSLMVWRASAGRRRGMEIVCGPAWYVRSRWVACCKRANTSNR